MLAAMFERTPFGAAMIDPTGRFLRANPVFLRLSGWQRGRSSPRGPSATSPIRRTSRAAWNVFEELVQGRRSHADFESRLLRRNGQVISVRHTLARLADAEGRLRCMLAMVEDITDRRFANDALRESEARLQAFTNHSPALMFLKDAEGRYRFVERALPRSASACAATRCSGARDAEIFAARPGARGRGARRRGARARRAGAVRAAPRSTSTASASSVVSKFPVFDAGGTVVGVGARGDRHHRAAARRAGAARAAHAPRRGAEARRPRLLGMGPGQRPRHLVRRDLSHLRRRIRASSGPRFESYLERMHPEDRARAARDGGARAHRQPRLQHGRAHRAPRRQGAPAAHATARWCATKGAGRSRWSAPASTSPSSKRRARRRLQALTRRLVQAEEAERRRIARELHDRVGQNLSALNINLDILLGQLRRRRPPRRAAGGLARAGRRHAAVDRERDGRARPPLLDEYGLAARARHGTPRSSRSAPASGSRSRSARGGSRACAREAAVALFRIAQEALNNVAKHASAKRITVGLEEEGGGARAQSQRRRQRLRPRSRARADAGA